MADVIKVINVYANNKFSLKLSRGNTMWAGLSEGHTPYCLPRGEAIIELSLEALQHEISRQSFKANSISNSRWQGGRGGRQASSGE